MLQIKQQQQQQNKQTKTTTTLPEKRKPNSVSYNDTYLF